MLNQYGDRLDIEHLKDLCGPQMHTLQLGQPCNTCCTRAEFILAMLVHMHMHGACMVHAHAWHMHGICVVYTRPEPMCMVAAGDHYNSGCCFDYGNAEVDALDDGKGITAAIQPLALTLTLTLTLALTLTALTPNP